MHESNKVSHAALENSLGLALATVAQELFPDGCKVAVEPFASSLAALSPGEHDAIRKAVPKRQAEFAAGRIAARQALAALGITASEIPMGADRAPQWPAGVVGSISHANGFAIAVVAKKTNIIAVGIDVEVTAAIRNDLFSLILVESEHRWLDDLPQLERTRWASVIFSAKEAFYKFQYPLLGEWLDFRDVEVSLSLADGLLIRVLKPSVAFFENTFYGQFRFVGPLTLTAVYQPR